MLQVNGKIEPLGDNEMSASSLENSCDIASCAIRQDAWDGPVMSCYCEDLSGEWTLASVDLSELIHYVVMVFFLGFSLPFSPHDLLKGRSLL